MTPKEKFCLLAGFLKQDLFKKDDWELELFNPKTNELVFPRQLITDIIDALDQHDKQQKILDILKKKYAIQLFTDESWEQLEYKMLVGGNLVIDLTQEEYDLLKEWLK